MRDLKIRPGMDTPKAKQKNPTPKDAESILKKHMDKRQKEKEPESRDPVRYATDRVEKNMRRGAAGAADASRRMIKRYQEQNRQGKNGALESRTAAETLETMDSVTPAERGLSDTLQSHAARNEVGNQTVPPQNRGGTKSANAAPQESRLWAEPCREKNSRAAHCTSTVRPWRYNDHSAERQFGGIGQGQSGPQEQTDHDQGRTHHACSTN